MSEVQGIKKLVQLSDYLSIAQIFLKDNIWLDRPLEQSDIKDRLLGHWGTCPGINLVYANINRLITKYDDKDFICVVGPGHGFPAFQANLFIDGSLSRIYPDKIPFTKEGAEEIITNFSTPYGYPSHLNPEAPGVILEGGELGYSLSVAAGSVLDNPRLINVCIVGDGEAETGPLAASWNVNRFINPNNDGVLLPVLHLNGYKISGPTIFGRMSNDEISDFFRSHGYSPLFIDSDKQESLAEQSIKSFDAAIQMINTLKAQANSEHGLVAPRWPVIILKTPKGLGAPVEVGGVKVEGNYASHQIVFDKLKADSTEAQLQLKQLESWLKSYDINTLIKFNQDGEITLDSDITKVLPQTGRSIGDSKYANGKSRGDLQLPNIDNLETNIKQRGEKGGDEMRLAGQYMAELFDINSEKQNFRLFSPDETYSNHLEAVFNKTSRAWQWPIQKWDKDLNQDGRVIEILSEHTLFGMLIGYTITGRYGFFVTYEAFATIVVSMIDQYIKFLTVSKKVHFREPVAPLNIILTSLLERQDHNGYSHQNPSFISHVLDHSSDIVNVYFPADKNLMLQAMDISLTSNNSVNIIVAGKKMTRNWLTPQEAEQEAEDGAMVWEFLSNPGEPDVVVVTCGDYITQEAVIGVTLFRQRFPKVKIRFVNFFKLDILAEYTSQDNKPNKDAVKDQIINKYFTQDKPIIFNFHGYTATIKKLLFDYNVSDRIIINGYAERGSTTTPFDMIARNGLSRYHLVNDIATQAQKVGAITSDELSEINKEMKEKLKREKEYIIKHKIDPPEINNW